MNTLSIPMVAMAAISLYVGFYHLLIFLRRRQNREDLTFALLCFAYVFYAAFCAGLYNAASLSEGVRWQRAQFIALAVFVPVFLWFVADYTRRKPGITIPLFSVLYLFVIIVQLVDRSEMTFLVDQPSIKQIVLPHIQPITYYEATVGPFSTAQGILGMLASTYVLVMAIRYFRRGYKRESVPLILAIGLMYAAGLHDTLVTNGVYQFIYLIEYAYLAVILVMAYSLSSTVVEAAIAKDALRRSEERFRAMIETTSDWVWEVDARGVYTYASPKVRDLLGYEPEEILGRTPSDLMPPDSAERILAVYQKYILHQKPINKMERITRCKDGQLLVLETSGVPFFDETGRLSGYRGIDRDITERKKVEEALQAKTQELDRYFTSSLDLLCIADTDGYFHRLNPEWEKTLGYTLAELEGRQLLEFVHPQDVEATVAAIGQLKAQQQVQSFENRYRCKDGSYRWIEWRSYPEDRMIYAVARDITERKQVEEALRESERKFRLFVEQSSDGLVFTDEHGTIIEWNQAQESLTGFSRQESIGVSLWDVQLNLLPATRQMPELREELKQRILMALQSGRADFFDRPLEVMLVRRDGTKVVVQQMSFAIKTNEGYRLGSIIRDITQLKQVEEDLRESEERYRQLVEVSPIPMWINRDGVITYMNPAALRVLGATDLEQVMGKSPYDFIHPDYHPLVKERITQTVTARTSAPMLEEKYVRLDGKVIDVEVIATPFATFHGSAIQVLFQDITQRKQSQAERETLIRDLEAKNAELERFTYTVSHDLKAPLITIRGFLGYIEQDVISGDMERLKADMQRIAAATDKLHRLLNELLELSRIGRLMNPPENVSFGDLVQESLKLMEGRLREKNTEVKIQGDLPVVFGDAQRLQEVIQNLLDNAAKFMGAQTQPLIEIGTCGEEHGMPVLYVRDNGIGIAPEHHERIFGLFNKLNPEIDGTGVGLTIVKRIIEVHGGRIWIASQPGQGSTFYFTLGQGYSGS
ncbi:MAG: PAS domain S-box protein [Anaerolineales bacterium]